MTPTFFEEQLMPHGPPLRRPARVDAIAVGAPVDVERLSRDLADIAASHSCPTCVRSPGHRFELLRALGARLHPDARDRLELIELAGHLAWTQR